MPWYKKIQGNIGKINLGDKTGPVIIKKYKTYNMVIKNIVLFFLKMYKGPKIKDIKVNIEVTEAVKTTII